MKKNKWVCHINSYIYDLKKPIIIDIINFYSVDLMKSVRGILRHFVYVNLTGDSVLDYTQDEIRRIKMVNYIGLIGIICLFLYGLAYSIIDLRLYAPAIGLVFMSVIVIIGIIALNNRGFYLLSKLLINIIFLLIVVINSIWIFGKVSDSQIFFLLCAIVPVFLWGTKNTGYLAVFIGLNLVLYIVIEFSPSFLNNIIQMPDKYITFFSSSNVLVCFMGIALAIGVFIVLSNKKEKQLIKQASELKKSQIHRDMVYSIIAHDLRSPFNGFMSLTELLLNEYDDFSDEKKREYLQTIFKSSVILSNLLDNLLDWSKMQSGKLEANFKTLLLKQKIDEVSMLLKDLINNKGFALTVNIDPNLTVYADSYMVSTIIRNLLANAIKFTPNGGAIAVTAKQHNSAVEICVSDSGVGIPQINLDKLFNLSSTYTTLGTNSERGSGLGLKICKDFVEANGGKLWVESEPNKGSKFYFSLKSMEKAKKIIDGDIRN